MSRAAYPSDLTDAQWALIEPLLPTAKRRRRPRTVDLREILNAILYLLRTGCQWRALPHDLPPWSTVHGYFRVWRRTGAWQAIHDAVRTQARVAAGREPTPSAGSIDSQSVKTTEKGGLAASTPARRSTAASATWRWTRSGFSWWWSSTRRTCRTGMGAST